MATDNSLELKVGRTYRAKKPRPAGGGLTAFVNDRTIMWIGSCELQYDGPSVKFGRHYPRVSIEEFRTWADRDVTDQLPEGDYATWPIKKPEESLA